MEWTKEEVLDHINTNRFFAFCKLNGIFVGPSIYTNPPLPGEIGLLPYTTSHSQNTCDVKPNELEAPVKPDELESPLPTSEVPQELQYLHQLSPTQNTHDVKPDKLEAPLPILEVPQKLTEPAEPAVKHGQRHPWKHPITENSVTENHLTPAGTSVRQSPPVDISVLVQETPFTDSQRKETIKTLDEDKTQVDPSGNQPVDSSGNQ